MTKADLLKQIAQLETLNDHLMTELSYMDQLLRQLGFQRGLETVKLTGEELIRRGKLHLIEPK